LDFNKEIFISRMHGANIKIISAQQARICNIYKNTKLKLLGVCNVILTYFNVDIITKSASVGF